MLVLIINFTNFLLVVVTCLNNTKEFVSRAIKMREFFMSYFGSTIRQVKEHILIDNQFTLPNLIKFLFRRKKIELMLMKTGIIFTTHSSLNLTLTEFYYETEIW